MNRADPRSDQRAAVWDSSVRLMTPIPQTFEYEGMPGHVSLDTATFEERDGRTLVRAVSSFQSVEDRDAMIASGMEGGVRESYELLDELLAKLQAG